MELLLVALICLAAGWFLFRQMWQKMQSKSACDCCSKKNKRLFLHGGNGNL